jgi:hypothetical protein
MPNSVASRLELSLALFATDDHGLHLTGHGTDIDHYFRWGKAPISAEHRRRAPGFLGAVVQDLWNVATVIERLEWMRAQAQANDFLRSRWPYFAAADIQAVQVDLRSILDYVALTARLLLNKPGQAPKSFRALLDWADSHPARIPKELRDLLLPQRDWFMQVRRVRDSFVHFGAHAIVFGDPEEGILFQVYRGGFENSISGPALMWNDNVAYFDRYIAVVMGQLLAFLEEFGEVARNLLDATPLSAEHRARAYHTGFAVIRAWLQDMVPRLRKAEADAAQRHSA